MVITVLAANGQVAFPNGVGEDELRCPEVVAAEGVASDGTDCSVGNAIGRQIRCGISDLRRAARCLRIIEKTVDVEIDTQLAHLTIIIGIEDVLAETFILPDATFRLLGIFTVLIVDGIECAVEVAARMTVVLVESTEAMVLVDHIVHLQLRRKAFPDALRLLRGVALDVIGSYVIGQFVLLQRLGVTIAPCAFFSVIRTTAFVEAT